MNETSITQYITKTFDGVEVVVALNARFFFYDPERKFPFATLVTTDEHDSASNLSRPGVFRLNIGVSKPTFRSLFDAPNSNPAPDSEASEGDEGACDFTALDQLMPHPVYGAMYWVCVLNPSDATFQTLKPLLAEAYALCVTQLNGR